MNDDLTFFLIIPPGLEDLAQRELELKCPTEILGVLKGGLEVRGDLGWCERAHTLLKIPTRILLRITEFKVRDFPKLFQKFSVFKWNNWLSHPEPRFHITCSKSRINHTGKIEETIRDALEKALVRQPLSLDWQKKNYPPQDFYVRIVDDLLTLSLDLSGEPLYKRGLQVIKGEAPLRENFAAAMAFELLSDLGVDHVVVDPMCGSATLLTEALTFHVPLHERRFAFETAPFYKGRLLRLPPPGKSLPVSRAIGSDVNEDLLKKVSASLVGKLTVELRGENALEAKYPANSVMICNPPYGERIKIDGKRGSFLRTAFKKFITQDRPRRFGWILPSDMDDLFVAPEGYEQISKRHLKNGGLAVTFWIFDRR